ncbi:hypothetical protein FDP41_007477 [Naegleria fowleri]|uniref:Uncharacterized protein n=1 Tax=Naegleria fowleri TaxID=5763 RepID=A0A6A5CFF8_NAEFO|nr:uncharacterized protein FDP41_007477 [Naegleria fowleri]KAF0984300.1 hypothetical protein FDP41_007477 [Naegleria fowleri]CAG4713210.1 unnamed protein product [Naegleria fowleri]
METLFRPEHIHFRYHRSQVSTLKLLLSDRAASPSTSVSSSSNVSSTSTAGIHTSSAASNSQQLESTATNNMTTTNQLSPQPSCRSRRQPTTSRCVSPYKSPNTSGRLKATIAKGVKDQEPTIDNGASSSQFAEKFEQYAEMKKTSLECINKLNSLYNSVEIGVKELSNLWEMLTEIDEQQPGSLFLMDFEEDGDDEIIPPNFSMSNSNTFTCSSSKVNLKAQRLQICEQVTKLINIESTLLNLVESHQNMLESNFGFSFQAREELERVSSTGSLPIPKKLPSSNFKDIMEYIDFPSHIQRTVTCSKLFETTRKIIVPNEEEASEASIVELDVERITGASPLIRSLPSTTFPNNTSNSKVKWREYIRLEKLNKKFQKKLNEFEEVIIQFVQLKQQYS